MREDLWEGEIGGKVNNPFLVYSIPSISFIILIHSQQLISAVGRKQAGTMETRRRTLLHESQSTNTHSHPQTNIIMSGSMIPQSAIKQKPAARSSHLTSSRISLAASASASASQPAHHNGVGGGGNRMSLAPSRELGASQDGPGIGIGHARRSLAPGQGQAGGGQGAQGQGGVGRESLLGRGSVIG